MNLRFYSYHSVISPFFPFFLPFSLSSFSLSLFLQEISIIFSIIFQFSTTKVFNRKVKKYCRKYSLSWQQPEKAMALRQMQFGMSKEQHNTHEARGEGQSGGTWVQIKGWGVRWGHLAAARAQVFVQSVKVTLGTVCRQVMWVVWLLAENRVWGVY